LNIIKRNVDPINVNAVDVPYSMKKCPNPNLRQRNPRRCKTLRSNVRAAEEVKRPGQYDCNVSPTATYCQLSKHKKMLSRIPGCGTTSMGLREKTVFCVHRQYPNHPRRCRSSSSIAPPPPKSHRHQPPFHPYHPHHHSHSYPHRTRNCNLHLPPVHTYLSR
jgi:hypothetical protein